jgi:UPF0755 protein
MKTHEPAANPPGAQPLPRMAQASPPARRRRKLIYAAILMIALVIAAIAAVAVWVMTSVNEQVEHQASDEIISVEQGMASQAIIARLSKAGIVTNPTALKLYLRITGRGGQLKAGDYKFASPISPLQAIEKIRRADVHSERVTIPEGFNRFEIAELLAAKTGKGTTQEFLRLMYNTELVARIAPQARNLEGYLFPDTYSYTSKTTAQELIAAMVDRFQEVFTPEWAARASRQGMSVHEVVTLASIVEEEARVPDERPRVASVFLNRLKLRMALGSDPTFIYAAILAQDYDGNPNQPRHRRRDSPYNTYIHSGLPPGPIASPGRASLEATLFPEETDYLYFVVSGNEGRHKFSRNSAEHDAAVADYRRQQREQN